MPSIELNSQTPFVLTVSGSINSAGEVIADLTPADILDAGGALLASNNLSDVGSAATARTNLGGTATGVSLFTAASAAAARSTLGLASHFVGPITLNCDADGTLGVIKFQADQAGTITTMRGTLFGTGPSDQSILVSMTIGGVAVTGGSVTFNVGSNDGATATGTATAANTFVAGDVIAIGVTTTNTASLQAAVSFAYTIG